MHFKTASCCLILDIIIQVNIDFDTEPIGIAKDGKQIFFRDIWPSSEEITDVSGWMCFIISPPYK